MFLRSEDLFDDPGSIMEGARRFLELPDFNFMDDSSDGLFGFFIDHFFVITMSNIGLEGQFSTYDRHGNSQLDHVTRECMMQFLDWHIAPEKKRRCHVAEVN